MKIEKKQSEEKPVINWLYLESRVFTEYYKDKKGIFCESQDKRIYLNCKIIRTPKKKTLLDGNLKINNTDFTIMQYIQLAKLPDDPFELVLKLFGGIKKKLSGVRGQIQVKSISDSSKDELITYFIKAFRKISEVSKNKKTALSSVGNFIGSAESSVNGPCIKCIGSQYTCYYKVTTTTTPKKITKCPRENSRLVGYAQCTSCSVSGGSTSFF